MLDVKDFTMKQIIVFMPPKGDKLSYKNDNLIIKDVDGNLKYQITCYRIFAVIVIGDCSITTGLIRRAKKYGFSLCFMTYGFRFYSIINCGLEGNNYLHKKQYTYDNNCLGRLLILNKIKNQREMLNIFRRKSKFTKEGIKILDNYIKKLQNSTDMDRTSILGYEGNAAKVYFARMFDNVEWNGRKPRIKYDYINSLLDMGYTLLFNFIDCILRMYDFDVYQGILHTNFYMRKSLVCDLIEPFRPLIDYRVRKGINLGQFKQEDFKLIKNQWQLDYTKNGEYVSIFMKDILDNKDSIFVYIRSYYRFFMKDKEINKFPMYNIIDNNICLSEDLE